MTFKHSRSPLGFTLVEIMIVVLIIAILLSIAIPNFISARESSRARACVANLSQINSAKMQCIMDNKLSDTSGAAFSIDSTTASAPGANGTYQLTRGTGNPDGYLRQAPVCPSGGQYDPGSVRLPPMCSIATVTGTPADYQVGGRWYHGY